MVPKDPPGHDRSLYQMSEGVRFKDRHQWLGRELRYSISLSMDKSFPKAILYTDSH